MTNCIEGSAEVYHPSSQKPWNKRRIQHLYNRIGTGASMADIEWALSLTPAQVVDSLIDEAIDLPIPTAEQYPEVVNPSYGFAGAADNSDMYFSFLRNMVENPLRYKLVLFWSGHFVTENKIAETRSSFLHYYLTNLHLNAFGDFKEMTKNIGLTPRMLNYLNGNRNYRNAPNENYARELLELFTMGPGNYEQEDIEEIARLLTGWRSEWNPYYISYDEEGNEIHTTNDNFISDFNQRILSVNLHDWGEKIVMGKTFTPSEETQDEAYQEYLWLHEEVIFQEKADAIARFICGKIYRFYVYDEINVEFVETMATTFKNNDWQIEPVLRQLFKSEHFFDDNAIGGNIKSPLEYMLGFLRQAGLVYNEDYFRGPEQSEHPTLPGVLISFSQYQLHRVYNDGVESLGQTLFAPPNVAGWDGGKAWITENTLVKRWGVMAPKLDFFNHVNMQTTQVKFVQLVKDITQDFVGTIDSVSPEIVTEAIARHFIIADLSPDTLAHATTAFKGAIDENYFANGTWTLDYHLIPRQFTWLMNFLIKLPEYQLN